MSLSQNTVKGDDAVSDRYNELMDNIPGVFFRCACDEHWTMLHMSRGVQSLTSYNVEDIVGNNKLSFASLIHPEDADMVETKVLRAVEQRSSWNLEYRLARKDGTYTWVSEQGVGIHDESGKLKFLDGFVADISERKSIENALYRSEARIRELAFYDSVTGLPNRNLILERIAAYLDKPNRKLALIYIDLDGFKSINDQYGHNVGDKTLALTGSRLSQVSDGIDIVARIGGDEFLALCIKDVSVAKCCSIAQDVINCISQPIRIDDYSIQIGASIGISFSGADGDCVQSLINVADKAMFRAKGAGSNLIELSNNAIGSKAA